MKHMLLTLIMSFIGVNANASCVNISGEYSMGFDSIGQEKLVTLFQNGCEEIGFILSIINLSGIREEATPPIFSYVNENSPDLCRLSSGKCLLFKSDDQKISVVASGFVAFKNLKCEYDKFEWTISKGSLQKNYYVNDPNPMCKTGQIVTEVFPVHKN